MTVKELFGDLTAAELEALSATLRDARRDCRRVMAANWWNAPVTDAYRRMLVDLRGVDPLFTAEWRQAELRNP